MRSGIASLPLVRAGLVVGCGLLLGWGVAGAVTFEREVDLSESAGASSLNEISPQAVAVDGEGRVVVVWSEFSEEGGTPELMVRVRQPDGRWSRSALLTDRDGHYSGDAAVATTAEGRVAIAWIEQESGSFEVRVGWLDADRLVLTRVESLCEPTLLVMEPAIAAGQKGEIAVAWTTMVDMNYELRLRRRPPGQPFGPIEAVTPKDGRASDQVALAYGPDSRLHVVWADNRSGARRVLHGSLGPGKGDPPVEVAPVEGSGKQTRPCVTVGTDGRIHVAWMDSRSGQEEVFVAVGTGKTFSAPFRVGMSGVPSRSPCLVAAGSGVHLLWEDGRHGQGETASAQIYYARVGAAGITEETPVTTDLPVSCFNPCLAAGSGGDLHLVWRNAGFGEGDVFYRTGKASGPWSPR